jgi:hypothetical protein
MKFLGGSGILSNCRVRHDRETSQRFVVGNVCVLGVVFS